MNVFPRHIRIPPVHSAVQVVPRHSLPRSGTDHGGYEGHAGRDDVSPRLGKHGKTMYVRCEQCPDGLDDVVRSADSVAVGNWKATTDVKDLQLMVESEVNLVDERRQRLMAVRYRRELLVCGAEDASLLAAVFQADLAAFGAQSPELAKRYRD